MNKRSREVLIVLALTVIATAAFGQEKHVKRGDKQFAQRLFPEAIESYTQSLEKIKPAREHYVNLQIARAYKNLFDYRNAAVWFEKVSDDKDNEPEVYRDHGYVLLGLGQYNKALDQFRQYCNNSGREDQLVKYEKLCSWPSSPEAQKQAKYNVHFTDLPIGNRALGMTWFNEGIIFSMPQRDEQGSKTTYYDLAYAAINDSVHFGSPQVLSGLNRSFYDAAPSVTADGNTLYFTSNNTEEIKYKPGKKKKPVRADGRNVLQIYYATKLGSEWSKAEKVAFDSLEFNYAFPYITPDGNTLYFASDMPGGLGKLDIYKVIRTGDNQWSQPQNLGPAVNTEEDDIYPYVVGEQLYFSSRGREGFGGLDVYVADMSQVTLSNAMNMGMPVNSHADDFALIMKEGNQVGYLSSNRDNFSSDAVYALMSRPDTDTLRGIVTGDSSNLPMPGVIVKLYVLDESNNANLVNSLTTGQDGKWEFVVDPDNRYRVEFEMGGYDKKEVEMVAALQGEGNSSGGGSAGGGGDSGPNPNGYHSRNSKGEKKFKKDIVINLSKTASLDNMIGKVTGDTLFTVQIGAYKFPHNFLYDAVKSMGSIEKKKLEDGITRFTVNTYNTIQEARTLKEKIVAKGITDAFVLAIYKGKRVYIVDMPKEGLAPLQ